MSLLSIRGLTKAWEDAHVLQALDLDVMPGQHTLVMGPSGSGKSTLLHVIARLIEPDAGEVLFDRLPIHGLGSGPQYRRQNLGLIFQDVHLIESLSGRDNIAMIQAHVERPGVPIAELVEPLGLTSVIDRPVRVLSRGERQRVALARAFAGRPQLILADEPTASLDPSTAKRVLDLIVDLAGRWNSTLLMVTHDHEIATRPDWSQVFVMNQGRLKASGSIMNTGQC